MCTRPITQDGLTFACRTCDQCISTRRSQWVARAMAEKAMHSHALAVTLTYSDETQHGRDAARFFCYSDVRDFLKRVRSAAAYMAERERWNVSPEVRFLCAGEQGDRNGRCHWHLIIYTNFDLQRLGEFRLRGRLVSERSDMITEGKHKRRLNWSLWPWGFVALQEPDEAGMNYVLSYCLKDQFTPEKSKGTFREGRTDQFATGLFRMSKRPAIGEAWLYRRLGEYLAKGAVPTALQFQIPDMGGFWVPSGSFRKKALWALVALNQRIAWDTGRPAPQWSTLLSSLRHLPPDMEILNVQTTPKEDPSDFDAEIVARGRIASGEVERSQIVRRCGRLVPCADCLNAVVEDGALSALGVRRTYDEGGAIRYEAVSGEDWPKFASRAGSGVNLLCRKRGSRDVRLAFPASGGDPLDPGT